MIVAVVNGTHVQTTMNIIRNNAMSIKLIVEFIDHIYILAYRTILLKAMVYPSASSYCVVLAQKVKKSNIITMNLK